MRKIASKWVPHDLTDMHKWQRYDASRMHLQRFEREGEAFLRRIISIDETWAKSYEPELKRQSDEWRHHGSPRKQTVRPTPTNVKVMLILAYDWDGVIVNHRVHRGQNVNAAYYSSFLQDHLQAALRRKRCHHMVAQPIVLHDNARDHTAGVMSALMNRWGWEVLYHSPILPTSIPATMISSRR